jgi:hypothetical protein
MAAIDTRGHQEWIDKAANYVSAAFGTEKTSYPHWYLLVEGERIIGCVSLITLDFISTRL